jgi:hypothetical protein
MNKQTSQGRSWVLPMRSCQQSSGPHCDQASSQQNSRNPCRHTSVWVITLDDHRTRSVLLVQTNTIVHCALLQHSCQVECGDRLTKTSRSLSIFRATYPATLCAEKRATRAPQYGARISQKHPSRGAAALMVATQRVRPSSR